jgi:hypothetical protein
MEDGHWTIGGSNAWSRGGSGGKEVVGWRKGAGRRRLDFGAGVAWRLGVAREEEPATLGEGPASCGPCEGPAAAVEGRRWTCSSTGAGVATGDLRKKGHRSIWC